MYDAPDYPTVRLDQLVDVLDDLRAPVNGEERSRRIGTVPYYGANGQQGWIDKPLTNEPLILLAEDGGNFDAFAERPIAYRIDGPAWVNNHAHIIRAKPGVSQSFVYWSIAHKDIRRFIAGGTRAKLTQGELRRIEVRTPDEPQRAQIAEVLDTLDTTIRQTEAIIEKLKQVKQGLLHDLLTRGIDANGELRSPHSQAPHLYKESPLGWIPREWEARPLAICAEKITDRDHTTPIYLHDGVLMISPVNLYDEEDIDFDGAKRISQRAHLVNRKKTDLRAGDLIIHRIGAGLGRVRLITAQMPPFSILHSMAQIRPSPPTMSSEFMLWALRDNRVQLQIELGTQSIGVPDLGLDKIGGLLVVAPSLLEQTAIATMLSAHQCTVNESRVELNKLRMMKSGLMGDLLTGRVRVTPLLA